MAALAAVPVISPVKGYVRLALGEIYERMIEKVTDPEEEGTLSGSYAVAARRRARLSKDGERDDLSEASPSDLGSPFNAASESLFALTTHRSSLTSCPESLNDEFDDSSEEEPVEAILKAAVTTHRRASLDLQRRLTIARYQSEDELPRLLGNFAAASEIPDKAVL